MRLLKTFSLNAFTLFFNATVSFFSFSLLTHHLSKADYGTVNLYTSFALFLTPFIAVGVPFLLSVDFFKQNENNFKRTFANALILPGLVTALVLLILVFTYRWIDNLLRVGSLYIFLLPVYCFIVVMNEIFLNLVRNKNQLVLFSIFSITKNLLEIAWTIILVVQLSGAWQGRLSSTLLGIALSGSFVLYYFSKNGLLNSKKEISVIQSIAVSGLPFIPERLAVFVLGYSDRFFINHFAGTSEVGLYSAGAQFASIIGLSIIILNNTFYPNLFRSMAKGSEGDGQLKKMILVFVGIALFITIAVLLLLPFLFRVFIGDGFQQAQTFARFLVVGLFFWAIYNVFIAFLLYLKKNRLIMTISIIGMCASLLMNYVSVVNFGAIGATYASAVVYFIMATLSVFFVQKHFGLTKLLRA